MHDVIGGMSEAELREHSRSLLDAARTVKRTATFRGRPAIRALGKLIEALEWFDVGCAALPSNGSAVAEPGLVTSAREAEEVGGFTSSPPASPLSSEAESDTDLPDHGDDEMRFQHGE